MDHSVHLPKTMTRSNIKKSINSKTKGKTKKKKSPGIKYGNKQIRSRSQSKTVAKYYPSKDNSFCKLNNHKRNFPLYSTRTIGIRSRTPNLCRINPSKKQNTSRFPKKSDRLHKISEMKSTYSDLKKNNGIYFNRAFDGFPFPSEGKNEENMQKNHLTAIDGYHLILLLDRKSIFEGYFTTGLVE
jgi:hypothetical protein